GVCHGIASEKVLHLARDLLPEFFAGQLLQVRHIVGNVREVVVNSLPLCHGAGALYTRAGAEDLRKPWLLVHDLLESFALRHALSALKESLSLHLLNLRLKDTGTKFHQQVRGSRVDHLTLQCVCSMCPGATGNAHLPR